MPLRAIAHVAVVVVASAGSLAATQDGSPAPSLVLRVEEGMIEARIRALPLPTVLETLARATGATVTWTHQASAREVSAEFPPLPLDEGLRRLFGSESFTLTTRGSGKETRIARLSLVPRRRDGSAVATIVAGGSDAVPIAHDPHSLEASADLAAEMAAIPDPVARIEAMHRLADGPRTPSRDDVLARAMLDDVDVGVRREAFDVVVADGNLHVEQTVALLQREPEAALRRHVLPQLAEHVDRDDEAWSVAAWLAGNDPDPDVRAIAAGLLGTSSRHESIGVEDANVVDGLATVAQLTGQRSRRWRTCVPASRHSTAPACVRTIPAARRS